MTLGNMNKISDKPFFSVVLPRWLTCRGKQGGGGRIRKRLYLQLTCSIGHTKGGDTGSADVAGARPHSHRLDMVGNYKKSSS